MSASGVSAPSLPAGYIAAEFLESTGTQYINTDITPFRDGENVYDYGIKSDGVYTALTTHKAFFGCTSGSNDGNFQTCGFGNSTRARVMFNNTIYNISSLAFLQKRHVAEVNFYQSSKIEVNSDNFTNTQDIVVTDVTKKNNCACFMFAIGLGSTAYCVSCRVYDLGVTKKDELIFSARLAIDPSGVPCVYDKVSKQPFYNKGSGSFIVGLNLKQALKLADLPTGGGTLTISLPTGYESDAGVDAALQTARSNGWTITVQTYTPEAEAAANTFGMRRIWVRKQQDENGSYVDADGMRWQVEWCVEMYTPDNSTPDMHGYEMYRSVDAAVAYWGLTPYVDPEAEELLLESQEQ